MSEKGKIITHFPPQSFSDRAAYALVKFMRFIADTFFAKRYGHRAVVLETVAGVPGMVGGMLQHLKSLRRMKDDDGKIRILLDEAENERMHLMTFIQIAKPTLFERILVLIVQGIFFNVYFLMYLFFSKVCHRFVGYLEEEAVISYMQYLEEIDSERVENVPAPSIAIKYWNLAPDARLKDVVLVVRDDEMRHRDNNHQLANELVLKKK